MKKYRQLSFLPILAPAGRPDPEAEALRCRPGVEFHELSTRETVSYTHLTLPTILLV